MQASTVHTDAGPHGLDVADDGSVPVLMDDEQAAAAAAAAEGLDDDDDDDVCGPSFFEEEAQCRELLAKLADLLPASSHTAAAAAASTIRSSIAAGAHMNTRLLPSLGQDPSGAAGVVRSFTQVIDRYQESPHLLYPYLEGLVAPLVALLLRYLPPATEVWAYEQEIQEQQQQSAKAATATTTAGAVAHDDIPISQQQQQGGGPSALGRNYDMFDADAPKTAIHLVCNALYAVVKTAGDKACTSHFPNDVRHYEDVFYGLRLWKNTDDADLAADAEGTTWASIRQREWEVRYCLLLWLCNLVLVPFSLSTIDSSVGAVAAADLTSAGRIMSADSLSDALLVAAVQFLADASKCRDGAALLVARLLTRPDSRRHRDAFFGYATALVDATVAAGGVVVAVGSSGDGEGEEEEPYRQLNFLTRTLAADAAAHPNQRAWRQFQNVFLVPGILSAMSKTLKLGQRREMLPYAAALIPGVAALLRLRTSDALLCKMAVKVVQRLVLAMLKNKSAAWKYKRHDVAALAVNLGATTKAAAASTANEEEKGGGGVVEGDEDALEEGIGLLLETLSHKDTIVRWSTAKGVGRVCDRLPADMAGEVTAAVYSAFDSAFSDAAWHGGLLALAELCRRSIIDAAGLALVVPKIAAGLSFDLSKGTYSVGAHVRDAACYTCWSIARAYDAADLAPHVHRLSAALVVAALFDREVNVRRAAAAAFQECVGRLGTFPNGIELVTAMDFFSLASRKNAFLEVAVTVARYDAYRGAMLDELVAVKLVHWDRDMRQCAAGALGRIAAIEHERNPSSSAAVVAAIAEELQRRVTDQTVATRHGAILGLAELVRGGLPVGLWTEEQREGLAAVVVRLDQARLFRSRGGEHIRHACCALLSACAAVALPLPVFVAVTRITGEKAKARTLGKVQEFLEDTWKNILEWLQLAAADTFAAVAAAYYTTDQPKFYDKIIAKMLDATAPPGAGGVAAAMTPLERRGFLAAMGGLPAGLLTSSLPRGEEEEEEGERTPHFIPILANLCVAAVEGANGAAATTSASPTADSEPQQQQQQLVSSGDAESRRNAVRSLAKVLATIPVGHPSLTPGVYRRVLSGALLAALQDYAVDKRGDVGSFVRIAVLQSLPAVVRAGLGQEGGGHLILLADKEEADDEAPAAMAAVGSSDVPLGVRVLQGAVKASLEKLDRVRSAAGAALVALLVDANDLLPTIQGGTAEATETACLQALVSQLHTTRGIEWTNPREVIAAVAPALLCNCPCVYAGPAMEGLVLSAGDLSLHVQHAGMQALLAAFRGQCEAPDSTTTVNGSETVAAAAARLSFLVVGVGATYAHTERVLVPLSRVLDRLLGESLLDEASHPACVTLLRAELRHYATAITVLLPLASLLATLCRSPCGAARRDAWSLALTMVASRYPTVRARMATDLYTALLVFTASAEAAGDAAVMVGCSHAMDKLLRVQWDSPDAGQVRAARNALYEMLGVAPPQKGAAEAAGEMRSGPGAGKAARATVASSYAHLVQEAGY